MTRRTITPIALWTLPLVVIAVVSLACATPQRAARHMRATAPAVRLAPRWTPSEYAAMARRGKPIFAQHCMNCHSTDGLSVGEGPDLSDYGSEGWSHARTADYIRNPQRYYPGIVMPSFGAKIAKKGDALTPRQINEVTAYVRSLRHQAKYLPKDLTHQPVL